MSEWRVLGQHDGYKVRLTAHQELCIADDVFAAFVPMDGGKPVAIEALVNGEPRTFALRPQTTGGEVTVIKKARRNQPAEWRVIIEDFMGEVGIASNEWAASTEWRIADGMLIVRVPPSRRDEPAEAEETVALVGASWSGW